MLAQPLQGLGAGNDIGLIGLLVLHRSLIGGGKEECTVGISFQVGHIGIEVGCLLLVVEEHQVVSLHFAGHCLEQCCPGGARETLQVDDSTRLITESLNDSREVGMMAIWIGKHAFTG